MDSVHKNFNLAPDLKKIKPKKVANDQKINFFHKKMMPDSKPEWNREAITVFSRLPSLSRLQATPLLQTSLIY